MPPSLSRSVSLSLFLCLSLSLSLARSLSLSLSRSPPVSLSPLSIHTKSSLGYFAHVRPVKPSIASTPRWRKHVWLASWLSSQLTVSTQITPSLLLFRPLSPPRKVSVERRSLRRLFSRGLFFFFYSSVGQKNKIDNRPQKYPYLNATHGKVKPEWQPDSSLRREVNTVINSLNERRNIVAIFDRT